MLSLLLLLLPLLLPLLLLLVRLNLLVFACLIPWRAPPCVCRGRRILNDPFQFWLGQAAELCRRTSGPQVVQVVQVVQVASPMWSLNQGLEEPKTQPVSAEKLRTLLAGRF